MLSANSYNQPLPRTPAFHPVVTLLRALEQDGASHAEMRALIDAFAARARRSTSRLEVNSLLDALETTHVSRVS